MRENTVSGDETINISTNEGETVLNLPRATNKKANSHIYILSMK